METNIQQLAQGNLVLPQTPAAGNQELNMEDFFKLLTVQLTSQDPLKPMEDTEFISQMTGFSSLAEMKSMGEDMRALRLANSSSSAQMLIGREVIAITENGDTIQGVVTRLTKEGDEMVPYIGDQRVSISSISQISNGTQI
jgi:flagellar basal-body rod modification protein FlgD